MQLSGLKKRDAPEAELEDEPPAKRAKIEEPPAKISESTALETAEEARWSSSQPQTQEQANSQSDLKTQKQTTFNSDN